VRIEHPGSTNAQKPQTAKLVCHGVPVQGWAILFGQLRARRQATQRAVYIDFGNAEQNTALLESLLAQRSLIESQYVGALSWEELPDKRVCRICDYTDGDVSNGDQPDVYIDWFFDTGVRLRKAIDIAIPHLPSDTS
jgi:hypothetical protein